jgi:hypothetical protein
MRLTKKQKHEHLSIKFEKKLAILRNVQNELLFFEHYYVGYRWEWISETHEREYNKKYYEKHCKFPITAVATIRTDEKLPEFTSVTHRWVELRQFSERLPEDEEVREYLMQNSPLKKALTE